MDNSRNFFLEFEGMGIGKDLEVKHLSINFGEVRFLDSSGIGAIIKCTNLAKEKGIDITVFNLNKTLFSVFRLSGLQHILTTLTLNEYIDRFPEFQKYLSKYHE
ncbi:STAS domain-containing protein [Leptospira sp. GIMC2001]|nr:STAS domain-containing protein [Leptospira sp. GIMC2001]WCL50866.1 STAS domain-containing protein [Leptospira sp. GIMC2001]